MDHFINQFTAIAPIGLMMLVSFLIFRTGYGVHVHMHGYSYTEAISRGNNAALIRFAGIFFGSAIAFWGTIAPTELGFVQDLIKISQNIFLVMFFMIIAGYVNDKFILISLNNLQLIFREDNVSVAIVELASFVATGLIFSASQSGTDTLLSSVVWFVFGQGLLILSTHLWAMYSHGWKMFRREMDRHMHNNNCGYALALAGYIISLGIVLNVVIKNVEKIEAVFSSLFVWFVVTVVLQSLKNHLVVRHQTLKYMIGKNNGGNLGAGVLEGAMYLSSALIITVLN